MKGQVHYQTHRVRAALVPSSCDGKLRPIVESWVDEQGRRCIGPAIQYPVDTRTVAERERDLYETVMREGVNG